MALLVPFWHHNLSVIHVLKIDHISVILVFFKHISFYPDQTSCSEHTHDLNAERYVQKDCKELWVSFLANVIKYNFTVIQVSSD